MSDESCELFELLKDRAAAYRPAMFWLLNGEVTAEWMREQAGEPTKCTSFQAPAVSEKL